MVDSSLAVIAWDFTVPLRNEVVRLALFRRVEGHLEALFWLTRTVVSLPLEPKVALPVLLGALAHLDVDEVVPLLAVEAARVALPAHEREFAAHQAIRRNAAIRSPLLVIRVFSAWRVLAFALSHVQVLEIYRYY